jgi:hypothetical protein
LGKGVHLRPEILHLIPELTPLDRNLNLDQNLSKTQVFSILDRLEFLIKTCPDEDVNTGMFSLYRENKMKIRLMTGSESTMFLTHNHKNRDELEQPTILYVNLDTLTGLSTPADVMMFWSTLVHEYTHYKQYSKLPSDFRLDCESLWRFEDEAYRRDMEVIVEWGFLTPRQDAKLRSLLASEEYMNRSLFKTLTSRGSPYIAKLPHCQSVWALLALQQNP